MAPSSNQRSFKTGKIAKTGKTGPKSTPLRSFKKHYSRFLSAQQSEPKSAQQKGRLHFAAHSHHLWPDCTREAQLRYWDDSARLIDAKWQHTLGEIIFRSKQHIARILSLSDPSTLATAPNTHEFVARILSCFEPGEFKPEMPLKVLTTDSEFYSFARQLARYEELPWVSVRRVPVEPFESFDDRLHQALSEEDYRLIFLSQTFFNSGFSLGSLKAIVDQVRNPDTLIVIDGYHSFCALPTDLSEVEERIFYMAGGYKYAQSGEGACFLHVPKGTSLRPLNTGWFADFSNLDSGIQMPVSYEEDGSRFAGSTFDPSGWYRFNAVMQWWQDEGIGVEDVHSHVQSLQMAFLELSKEAGLLVFSNEKRVGAPPSPIPWERLGHFLTYQVENAADLMKRLSHEGVIFDHRADRVRIGFGLYHDLTDVEELVRRLKGLNL